MGAPGAGGRSCGSASRCKSSSSAIRACSSTDTAHWRASSASRPCCSSVKWSVAVSWTASAPRTSFAPLRSGHSALPRSAPGGPSDPHHVSPTPVMEMRRERRARDAAGEPRHSVEFCGEIAARRLAGARRGRRRPGSRGQSFHTTKISAAGVAANGLLSIMCTARKVAIGSHDSAH